jgi:hypothetical protein
MPIYRPPTSLRGCCAAAAACSYYFNGQGDSIKAVLKSANLVDVDGLMGQVTAGQEEVLQGMAGNFTFRFISSLGVLCVG